MNELSDDINNGINKLIRLYVASGDETKARKKLLALVEDAYIEGRMSAFKQMNVV